MKIRPKTKCEFVSVEATENAEVSYLVKSTRIMLFEPGDPMPNLFNYLISRMGHIW